MKGREHNTHLTGMLSELNETMAHNKWSMNANLMTLVSIVNNFFLEVEMRFSLLSIVFGEKNKLNPTSFLEFKLI